MTNNKEEKDFKEVLLINMYHDLDVIKANINNDEQVKTALKMLKVTINLWLK